VVRLCSFLESSNGDQASDRSWTRVLFKTRGGPAGPSPPPPPHWGGGSTLKRSLSWTTISDKKELVWWDARVPASQPVVRVTVRVRGGMRVRVRARVKLMVKKGHGNSSLPTPVNVWRPWLLDTFRYSHCFFQNDPNPDTHPPTSPTSLKPPPLSLLGGAWHLRAPGCLLEGGPIGACDRHNATACGQVGKKRGACYNKVNRKEKFVHENHRASPAQTNA